MQKILIDRIDCLVYKEIKEGKSGEEIAKKLGVSRVSIWKRVKKMKEFLEIETRKGFGYRIVEEKDPNPYSIAESAFEFLKVDEVEYYKCIESTNDRAKEISKPNFLVFAEKQIKGRGRWGRRWESEIGGLYFTFTLRSNFEELQRITIVAGLAVAEALREIGIKAELKWPNDVLIDDKKVCGILCELSGTYEEPIVAVGIGINVRNRYEGAASLCDYGVCSLNFVFRKFCESFSKVSILSWKELIDKYRYLCKTSGKYVRVYTPRETLEGFAEIDDDGSLIVNGKKVLVGDCIHLR